MDSGWNCRPYIGYFLCFIAIIMPSMDQAITWISGGIWRGSHAIEWYRVALMGFGMFLKMWVPLWIIVVIFPCTGSM